jgi:hypothetical protein
MIYQCYNMVNVNAIVCVYSGCIIFGVGEGILSETEIAHLK